MALPWDGTPPVSYAGDGKAGCCGCDSLLYGAAGGADRDEESGREESRGRKIPPNMAENSPVFLYLRISALYSDAAPC